MRDEDGFLQESLAQQNEWKRKLRSAKSSDFQIVKIDLKLGEIKWAVSLHGCLDIATFIRKADAELFLRAWGTK